MSARIFGAMLRVDMSDGGDRRIAGTVTADGTPAVRRVRLIDQPTGRLLRETWSAPDGSYSFDWIRAGTMITLAHDHTGQFDPAAKSDLIPEPMP